MQSSGVPRGIRLVHEDFRNPLHDIHDERLGFNQFDVDPGRSKLLNGCRQCRGAPSCELGAKYRGTVREEIFSLRVPRRPWRGVKVSRIRCQSVKVSFTSRLMCPLLVVALGLLSVGCGWLVIGCAGFEFLVFFRTRGHFRRLGGHFFIDFG